MSIFWAKPFVLLSQLMKQGDFMLFALTIAAPEAATSVPGLTVRELPDSTRTHIHAHTHAHTHTKPVIKL